MRLVDPFPPIISFTLHSVGFLGIIPDEATQKNNAVSGTAQCSGWSLVHSRLDRSQKIRVKGCAG